MRKHSIGPWKTNDIGRPRIVADSDGNPVAMILLQVILDSEERDAVDFANATLVAAAPDMLDILKLASRVLAANPKDEQDLDVLRAVILDCVSKAEGKTK